MTAESEVIRRATAVAPEVESQSAQIEAERRLPLGLVERLREAGLFRLWLPRVIGGEGADFVTGLRVFEQLSHADGSAGWCVLVGNCSQLSSAFLTSEAAGVVYSDPGAILGGSVNPAEGRARVADGCAVVSGRWAFVSGSTYCSWFVLALVTDGGALRFAYLPRSDVEVEDTWYVAGLRGTGSNHVSVHGVVVPDALMVGSLQPMAWADSPLARVPIVHALSCSIAPVALGVARRALDEFIALASTKTPSGAARPLANRQVVQSDLARVEAGLRAARALFYDEMEMATAEIAARGELSATQRARSRLAAVYAVTTAASAVDMAYTAGGGTSLYDSCPLQRCFRDVHAVTQHNGVNAANFQVAGRLLLGLDTDAGAL